MKCVEVYKELYHQEPFDVAFCPYRISPLGAHIDHQYGKINGLAIDKGIHIDEMLNFGSGLRYTALSTDREFPEAASESGREVHP